MDNLAILVLNTVADNNKIYGYSITKSLQERGVFVSHQIVYRAVAKLLKNGLVKIEVVKNTGKPDRHLYTITSKGNGELITAIPSNRGKDTTAYLMAMLYPENLIYVTWAMAREQETINKLKKTLDGNDNAPYAESLLFESTHRLENIKHLAIRHEKK